ncbi:MAG TPA: hypothetical protein VKI65_09110 [Gemmataceae bacterium]|nr:hypothetical protein [Gemmataceae bacterium]
MTQENGQSIVQPPGDESPERHAGRKRWPLWVLGGALIGAIAGMNLADDHRHGFYLGGLIGAITEALVAVWVNALPGGPSGSLRMAFAVVATGLGVGAAAGTIFSGQTAEPVSNYWLTLGIMLGGAIAVLDRVIVWFYYPYGEGVGAPAVEPTAAPEESNPDDAMVRECDERTPGE